MEPVSCRRSIRLNKYDYSLEGAYFITICIEQKERRLGHIADGVMRLNNAGRMVSERIQAIPVKFPGTFIDSIVVMLNHIHFIISLSGLMPNVELKRDGGYVGAAPRRIGRGRPLSDRQGRESSDGNTIADEYTDNDTTNGKNNVPNISGPDGPKAGTHEGAPIHGYHLGEIVGWFKASSTNYYIRGVKAGSYPTFNQRLWQRNFYEHIIRTQNAYDQIDEYIRTNPMRWAEDRLR